MFNGTIYWARAIEKWATRQDGSIDYAQPFSGLDTFRREAYDAWVADLECPVTDKLVPYDEQISSLVFNCRPSFLPFATKYFNIIDLANNHTDNKGREGLEETRQSLQKAGVQYFGDYDPAQVNNTCEVVALPIKVKVGAVKQDGKLPVAFCAWHYFYRLPQPGEIERMKEYAAIMPVFAFVHMGAEYHPKADAFQRQVAEEVTANGPAFLIMNNPHWVQDSDVINNKLVLFSTGNFIFDQPGEIETTRSASLDVTINVQAQAGLDKWLKLGESCGAYHDDCLKRAEEQKLPRLKLGYSFDIVAGDATDRITKKGNDAVQAWIKNRLDWQNTINKLR